MIKFTDFFKVPYPEKTKVKFNMNAGNTDYPAWDYLYADDPEWLNMNSWRTEQNNNNYGNAEYVLSFAQYYIYGTEFYVFGGMYRIETIKPSVYDGVGYKLTLMDDYTEYRKRLIIKLKKSIGRNSYNRLYNNIQTQLDPEIYEITPSIGIDHFPGYGNVLINHETLQKIARNEAPKWKRALSSVKGVYCITDTSTGQVYIGSASGDDGGIWQRWSSYADVDDLTGGNKTFEELKNSGADYIISNFSYSILEVFDMRTDKKFIVKREEHWKKVFQSVKYGMNNVRPSTLD